jgi:hypothetical protein
VEDNFKTRRGMRTLLASETFKAFSFLACLEMTFWGRVVGRDKDERNKEENNM